MQQHNRVQLHTTNSEHYPLPPQTTPTTYYYTSPLSPSSSLMHFQQTSTTSFDFCPWDRSDEYIEAIPVMFSTDAVCPVKKVCPVFHSFYVELFFSEIQFFSISGEHCTHLLVVAFYSTVYGNWVELRVSKIFGLRPDQFYLVCPRTILQ